MVRTADPLDAAERLKDNASDGRPEPSGHERHELRRHRDEGSHHVAILMLQDVAVVHVAAAVGLEADGDLDDLVRVYTDRVLEAALVVVDRVVPGGRS